MHFFSQRFALGHTWTHSLPAQSGHAGAQLTRAGASFGHAGAQFGRAGCQFAMVGLSLANLGFSQGLQGLCGDTLGLSLGMQRLNLVALRISLAMPELSLDLLGSTCTCRGSVLLGQSLSALRVKHSRQVFSRVRDTMAPQNRDTKILHSVS